MEKLESFYDEKVESYTSSHIQAPIEDACKSFDKYLVNMIVEQRKLKDLMDVEEVVYCWKSLSSPVFKDLVCRFYAELCHDLFTYDTLEDYSL